MVVIGSNLGAVGSNSPLSYSYDGVTFTNVLTGNIINNDGSAYTVSNVYSIIYDGNMWIARVSGAYSLIYSYDSIHWKVLNSSPTSPGNKLVYTFDKYYLLREINLGNTLISYNLIDWDISISSYVTDIFYDGKIYLRGSFNYGAGIGGSISYSYDGITWYSTNANTFMNDCYSITGNDTIYVATGNQNNSDANLYSIIYSYDGITWVGVTDKLTLIHEGYSVVWNGSIFVCVGVKGSNSSATNIVKSVDGINWTVCISPSTLWIWDIKWSNKLWFILVRNNYYGRSYTFYSSPDLITWTTIDYSSYHYVTSIAVKYTVPQKFKGLNLFSSTNSLYRYYGSSTTTFSNIKKPQICYGQTTVAADSTVDITNLPYTSTSTYFAVAQVSGEPTTYAYGQALKLSASSIRLYNQDSDTSHTVMWKTIGY